MIKPSREEYLRQAVSIINTEIFSGDVDLETKQFQISCGKCSKKKGVDIIFPSDDLSFDDFFPPSIIVDHSEKDFIKILSSLTWACIHIFFNEPKCSKNFKHLAEKYYFDKPFNKPTPTDELCIRLNTVYKKLKEFTGCEWPGYAIVIPQKEQGEKKKSTYKAFCPECDYEVKISKKMLEKYNFVAPTCPCGCKMGIDYGEEETEQESKN